LRQLRGAPRHPQDGRNAVNIPITDDCRVCGAMLAKFSERFACRACFERGIQDPPTLCARCLAEHKRIEHGLRETAETCGTTGGAK